MLVKPIICTRRYGFTWNRRIEVTTFKLLWSKDVDKLLEIPKSSLVGETLGVNVGGLLGTVLEDQLELRRLKIVPSASRPARSECGQGASWWDCVPFA